MSLRLQAEARGPSFICLGKRPHRTPSYQLARETGISAKTSGRRMNESLLVINIFFIPQEQDRIVSVTYSVFGEWVGPPVSGDA